MPRINAVAGREIGQKACSAHQASLIFLRKEYDKFVAAEVIMSVAYELEPIASDGGRVIATAAARAADLLGVRNSTLAHVLGVSEASISRLKAGRFLLDPGSKPFELAILFVRLFRGLDAIVGGDANSARSWMTTENIALRGRPIDLIASITGLMAAVSYVDARRARI